MDVSRRSFLGGMAAAPFLCGGCLEASIFCLNGTQPPGFFPS